MKHVWLVGMAVAGLSLAGCAGAKETRRHTEGAAAGTEEMVGEKVEGVVVSVMGNTITVQSAEEGTIELQRGSETKVMREDEELEWTDLSEGMPVRVMYDQERAAKVKILTGAEGQEVKSRVGTQGSWPRPDAEPSPGEMPPPVGAPDSRATDPESMGHDHDSHDSLDKGSIEE